MAGVTAADVIVRICTWWMSYGGVASVSSLTHSSSSVIAARGLSSEDGTGRPLPPAGACWRRVGVCWYDIVHKFFYGGCVGPREDSLLIIKKSGSEA